jgi:hypothetical protein
MNYSIPIKLSKDFMMKVHAHPLLAEIKGSSVDDPFYQSTWKKKPETIQFNFGGWNRNQFKGPADAEDFRSAFQNLLKRSNIDSGHEEPLLYISAFQYLDPEKQSIKNNSFNYYQASGGFLLDLYIKGIEHFQKMENDPEYFKIDENPDEIFFSLLDPQEYPDLDDHYSPGAITYQSFKIGKSIIRIPDTYQLSISNSIDKKSNHIVDIPATFTRGILDKVISNMIREHEEKNTDYLEVFNEEFHNLNQLKTISKQKKKSVSEDVTVVKIGNVVHDYLKSNYIAITKSAISDFLWEYFALLKAYKVKNNPVPPSDYSELTAFYRSHKITKESIRLKFKNISIEGYF